MPKLINISVGCLRARASCPFKALNQDIITVPLLPRRGGWEWLIKYGGLEDFRTVAEAPQSGPRPYT